jgi:hypothetical protein
MEIRLSRSAVPSGRRVFWGALTRHIVSGYYPVVPPARGENGLGDVIRTRCVWIGGNRGGVS